MRLLSLVLLLAASGTAAQTSLVENPSATTTSQFGRQMTSLGDIDGDGVGDYAISAIGRLFNGNSIGAVYVFSGVEHLHIRTLVSPYALTEGGFGSAIASSGDVNDDGVADLIVGSRLEHGGATRAGRAYVFSGANGAILDTLVSPTPTGNGNFGATASTVGDLNGDGYAEVVIGAPNEPGRSGSDGGVAYVFSIRDGTVLHTLVSPDSIRNGRFGFSLSGLGDVTGDNIRDFVIGAPFETRGRVHIIDGAQGTLLRTVEAPETSAVEFGYSVTSAGDLNEDGFDDLFVGSPKGRGNAIRFSAGRVYALDGTDGSVLRSYVSPNETEGGLFGFSVASTHDLDGAGGPDLVVGAPYEDADKSDRLLGTGRAYVLSGTDGGLILSLEPSRVAGNISFGYTVASVPNLRAPQDPTILISAPYDSERGLSAGLAYASILDSRLVSSDPRSPDHSLTAPNPNPSTGSAQLNLTVQTPQWVRANVFNARGQHLSSLFDGLVRAGESVSFEVSDALPPGLYAIVVQGQTFLETRKVVIVR